MSRGYSAFLLRLWRRADGSQRIEIEHIQAGTRGVVASPAAALAWLAEHADDPPLRQQGAGRQGTSGAATGPVGDGEAPS